MSLAGQREAVEAQQAVMNAGPDPATESDADACGRWYDEQQAELQTLQEQLTSTRLLGGNFAVRLPGARTKFVLGVDAHSQIGVYESVGLPSGPDATVEDEIGLECRGTERESWHISAVRMATRDASLTDGAGGKLAIRMKRAEGGDLVIHALREQGAGEVLETLGAHMVRLKQSRVHMVRHLQGLLRLKATPYSSASPEHERWLMRLWGAVFPDTPLPARKCTEWTKIGFQGSDPATDFRGMGLLGLHNLVDLAERHPVTMQGLVAAQEERDYPLAASGINISNMLLAMLSIDAAPNSDACLQWGPSSEEWNSDLFAFLCQLRIEGMEHPLEEVYCIAMELLEQTWVLTKASYMDYNFVLKNMRRRMEGLLARRPSTLGEFRVWILAA